MIARLWHGRTDATDSDEYLQFLKDRAIPDYRRIEGNQGVHLMRQVEGDVAHFYTLTFWDSMESVKAFAGEDAAKAKYYEEDVKFLLEFEPKVQHYELFSAA